MNALCIQIQQEKNYQRFEGLTRELHDVVANKERRFPERKSLNADPAGKGWKLMPGVAKHILKPLYPQEAERVEISIAEADELFREIRVENSFVDAEGNVLAIKLEPRSTSDWRPVRAISSTKQGTLLTQRPAPDLYRLTPDYVGHSTSSDFRLLNPLRACHVGSHSPSLTGRSEDQVEKTDHRNGNRHVRPKFQLGFPTHTGTIVQNNAVVNVPKVIMRSRFSVFS
jgi:hypothetical protein